MRLPNERHQIPEPTGKTRGFHFRQLKVQKVTVTEEGEILALAHHLIVSEDIDEDKLVVVVLFHEYKVRDSTGVVINARARESRNERESPDARRKDKTPPRIKSNIPDDKLFIRDRDKRL